MRGDYSASRAFAIALGIAASGGTAYQLLRDDVMAGRWSDSFVLVPILLCIACGAGHLAARALMDRSILSAFGFAIAFTAATILVVYTSVSKQAANSVGQILVTEASNKDRSVVEAMLRDAEIRYKQAVDQADKARSSGGCGRVCLDWSKRFIEVEAHIEKLKAELKGAPAPKPVAAGAERWAELINVLSGADINRVKALVMVVEPFAYSLVFEITVIACFGYGFGGSRRPSRPPVKEAKTQPTPNRPEPPGSDRRDPRIVSWCEEYARRHGRRPSIPEVQSAFNVGKTSAWRYSRSRHGVA